MAYHVLFVCLGNICRSPTAEAVFRSLAHGTGIHADSAGTADWHVGHPPDERAQGVARSRGYDMSKLRARQVHAGDFHQFDLILAMDASNMRDLRAIRPGDATAELRRFLDHLPDQSLRDVPDPYFTQGFEAVLDIAERAGRALIHDLQGSRQNSDDTRRGAPPAPTDAV